MPIGTPHSGRGSPGSDGIGFGERAIRAQPHERAQARVRRLDPRERGLDQLRVM